MPDPRLPTNSVVIDPTSFAQLNKSLQRLERFWTDQILYRL